MTTTAPANRVQPTVDPVSLAKLVVLWTERRDLRERLRARLEPLRRGGIVVVEGEWLLVEDLQRALKQAERVLTRLAEGGGDARSMLAEIDRLLHSVDWTLAEEVLADLPDRERVHREKGHELQAEVDRWAAEMDDLRGRLEQADRLDALVADEQADFVVLDSLVKQAARAVEDGLFADAATPMHRLRERRVRDLRPGRSSASQQVRSPRKLMAAVDAALRRAEELAVHTELVLLRTSRPEDDDIDYVVILRVPRASATHAVSVRSTRTLSRSDFEHIRMLTRRVGAAEGRRARRITPAEPQSVRADSGDVCRELQTLGDLIYRLVIPRNLRDELERELGGQVTITTNEQELPWELVRLHDTHLALRSAVARMPLGWTMPRLGRARREGRRVRFLLWHADPDGDLPGAAAEVRTIREGLDRDWSDRIEVEVIGPDDATGWLLNERLVSGDYDIVHFAGHARFDLDQPERSGLLLKDDVFTAGKIEQLVAGQPLVFLNACESSRTANEPEERSYLGHQSEGLASAFLYGGAVACVGSRWPVFDRSAGEFAVAFYKHLLEGNIVGEALRLAREESYAARGDEVTWATYALYGDPGFHITTPGAVAPPA